MGSTSEFVCPQCKFRLENCGGYTVGMIASCQTYYCMDCSWVFDHFTDHFLENQERDPFNSDRGVEGRGVPCPKCKDKNTDYWNPKFPCPKCGTKMRRGRQVMLWD